MTKTKKRRAGVDISYYVVAFMDVLGQQEHLRALDELPDKKDSAQMESFIAALKQTYGVVTGMRDSFEKFFKSFSKRQIDPAKLRQLSPEQRKQYMELTSNPIQFQRFSDSIVVFLSLRTDRFKLPTGGIFGVLGAAATSFLVGLAAGHPIRGGVDLGVAMEMARGEIYGSALARAYALESKVAIYPRIVLGDELIEYLQLTLKQKSEDIYAAAGKQMAQCCLDMIAVDDDGHPFLDYLGPGFKKHIAYELNGKVIQMAYEKVLKFSEKYKREHNTTLAFRYTLLRNYFEARLPLWFPGAAKMEPESAEAAGKASEPSTQQSAPADLRNAARPQPR
jgi:hypothetical protein